MMAADPGFGRGDTTPGGREHGQQAGPLARGRVRIEDARERRRQGQEDPGTVALEAPSAAKAPR